LRTQVSAIGRRKMGSLLYEIDAVPHLPDGLQA
jgi:hypothetical protein